MKINIGFILLILNCSCFSQNIEIDRDLLSKRIWVETEQYAIGDSFSKKWSQEGHREFNSFCGIKDSYQKYIGDSILVDSTVYIGGKKIISKARIKINNNVIYRNFHINTDTCDLLKLTNKILILGINNEYIIVYYDISFNPESLKLEDNYIESIARKYFEKE